MAETTEKPRNALASPDDRPDSQTPPRDHGGGLDAARARWGGARSDWLDLSTGINPRPYPVPPLPGDCWTALPDSAAQEALLVAARRFWSVPEALEILATPGASAPIARMPALVARGGPNRAHIPEPTYNEHAAAFRGQGWSVSPTAGKSEAGATILVHPNNPDGHWWGLDDIPESGFLVLDESFCDVDPGRSHLSLAATRPRTLVLKSFGKFWGLAGLRLGFVIGAPAEIAALREMIGPWAVSGPALHIGAAALNDQDWAARCRAGLEADAARLDRLMSATGAEPVGGTTLFRLYQTKDAAAMQERLARGKVWSRRFPYSRSWLRLGLPGESGDWAQLEAALA